MPRSRQWDSVAILAVPALLGDHATVVLLASGRLVVEEGDPGAALADAVAQITAEPPFRAQFERRQRDTWAVGVRRIDTVELDPDLTGHLVEVASDGIERTVRVDGEPKLVELPELGPVRAGSAEPYAATLWRLHGTTWEIELARL